jgi:hypothetical protein
MFIVLLELPSLGVSSRLPAVFMLYLGVHACPVTLHGRLTTNSGDIGTVSARHSPATVGVENTNGCTTC